MCSTNTSISSQRLSTVMPVILQLGLYYYKLMNQAMNMLSSISAVLLMIHNDGGQQLKEKLTLLYGQLRHSDLIYLDCLLLYVRIIQQQLLSRQLGSQSFSGGALHSLSITSPLNIDLESIIPTSMPYLVYQ